MSFARINSIARWAIAAVALAAIVTLYRRWLHVNPTTVALTLLLFILLLAANWGLRYAVVASVAATICYNYYFLPPVGTFTIADPQNWLALLAFLATALIASRLSVRIREEAHGARTRQHELEVLFQLSRELLQTDKVAELTSTIPGSIALVAHASFVALYLADADRLYLSGETVSALPEESRLREWMLMPAALRLSGDRPDPDGSRMAVPLRVGVRPRGLLLLDGVSFSERTFDAMGGLISIAIDRAQALEDVTRSEAAKESERLRGVMMDSITHELRTPLTSIKAAVTTLLSPEPINELDTRELLTVVDEESDRLNRLVAQAVEMTQLDALEIHMHTSPQRVDELLEGIAYTCGAAVAAREVTVIVPPRLPRVDADPQWIRKVLCNLLENAAKYSSAGPIEMSVEQRGAEVRISVADQGVGIALAEQSLIFDKFYRSHAQVQRVPGTGMGLAICRAILEAHGGSIGVTSQPGRGSVFTFSLRVSGAVQP